MKRPPKKLRFNKYGPKRGEVLYSEVDEGEELGGEGKGDALALVLLFFLAAGWRRPPSRTRPRYRPSQPGRRRVPGTTRPW